MERKRIPDTEWIDEVFDTEFLQANHERRGKRSSILKQAKIPNLDICDDEYDVRYGRKSQNLKRRVSFADTFQVKELNTGNIYDIPGRNAVESSKDSSFSIHFPNFNSDKEDKENVDINSFRIAMTETHQSMNQIIVQREIMAEDMSLSESVIVSEDLDKLPLNSTTLPNGLNKQTDFYGEQDMNLTLLPGNNLHHSELKNNIEENQYPTCTIVTSVSCMAHTFHCPDSKHNCLLQGRSHITQIEVPAVDDHLYLESIPIYSNDPDKENIYQKKLSAIASAQQGQKKSFRVVSDDVNNLNTKSQKALKPIFISENTIRPSEKATFTPKCLMSAGQTQLDVEDMDLTCDVTSITSTQIKSLTDRQTYGTTNKGASREGSKTMHFQSNNMDLTCLSVKSKKSLDLTGFDKLNLDTVSNEMDITCNFGSISRMDFQPGNPLTKPSIAKFLDHGESTVPYSPTLPIHSKNMEFSCIVPYESSNPSVNDFYVSRDSKVSPSDSIINTQQTNDTSGNKKSLIDISSNKQAYHFSQLFSGRENHDHTQRKSCTMDETICSPRVTKDLSILNKKNLSDANDEILNILSGVEHSIHKENDCLVGTLPPSASSSKISFAEEILQVSNNSLKRQLLTTEQGNLSTKPTITVFHDYGENTVPYSPTSPIISKSMEFTCMIPYKSRNPSVNGSEVSRSDSILNTQRTNDASGSKKGLMDISSNEQAYHFSQLFSDKENYNRTQRKSCAMDETICSPRVTKDLSILNKKNLSYVNDEILNIQSGVEHSILKENDCLVGTLPPSASSSKISFAEEILQVSNNSLEQPLLTTEPGNLLTKSTITEIHDYDENTVPYSQALNYDRTQRKSCAMDETICSPRVTENYDRTQGKSSAMVETICPRVTENYDCTQRKPCAMDETICSPRVTESYDRSQRKSCAMDESICPPRVTENYDRTQGKSSAMDETICSRVTENYDRTQRKSSAMDETICPPRVTENYDRTQRKSSAMDETICPPRVTENYDCTQRKSCAMDETICPGVTENNDRTQRKSCTMDATICSPRVTENYDRPQRESCDMEETICIPSVTKNLSILNEKNLSFPNDEILNIQSGVEHSILKENGRLVGTLPPSASSSNINSAEEILQVSNNSLKRSLLTTEQGNLSTKPTITEFHDYGENTVPYSPTLPINFKSMEFTCMVPYESRNHSVNDSEVSRSDSILNTQQTNDISGNKKSLMDISSNKLAYHFSQLFSDKENYNRTQRKSCAMDETIYPPRVTENYDRTQRKSCSMDETICPPRVTENYDRTQRKSCSMDETICPPRVAENYDRTQRKSCSMDETICSPRATKNLSILNKKNLSYVNDEILNIQSGVEHSIHKENDCLVGTLPPSASSSKISSAEEILQVSNNSLEQPLLTTEPGNLLTKLTITEFHDYDENTIPYSQTLPLHSKNMEFTCVNPSESSAPSVNDSDTYKDEIIFHEQTKNKDGETSKMSEKPESVYILPSSTTSTKTSSSNQLLKDSKNSLKRPLPSTPGIVYSIRNIKKHKVGHDDKKSDTENQDLGYSLKTLKHHELKVGIQSETNISAPLTVNNNSNMISLPTFIKHCVTPSENEQINNHITPLATIFSELPSSIFQNMSFKEFDVSSPRHQKKNDKSSVEEVNHSVTSNRCSLRRSSIKEKISNSYLMCSSSELKEIDVTAPSQPSLPEKSMDLDLDVPKSALLESSLVNPKNVSAQIEPSLLEKEIDLDIPKSSFWLESSSVNLKNGAVPPQPSLLEKEMDLDVPKSSVLLESSTLNMKNVTVPPQSSLLEKEMDLDVTKSSVLLESALVNPKSITPLPESSLHEKEMDLDVPKSSVLLESSNNIVESITSQPEPSLQVKEMDLDVPKSSVLLEPSTENVKNVTVPLRPSLLEKEMDVDVPKSSVFHESSTINMKNVTVPPQSSLLEKEMDLDVTKSSVLLESALVNPKSATVPPQPSLLEEEMDLNVPKSSVLLESSLVNLKTVSSQPEPSLQEEEMDLDVPKSFVLLESSTENAKTVTVSDVKLKHTFCEAVTSELPEITLSFESSMTGLKGATSEAQNIEQNFQAEVVFSSDVSQRTPLNEKMLHSSAFRLLHSETSITTDIYSMEQASSTVANSDLTDGAIITKVSVKTITNTTAEMKVELESPDKSEMEFEKMAAPQKSSAVACTKEELPSSSCPSNCPNVPESETITDLLRKYITVASGKICKMLTVWIGSAFLKNNLKQRGKNLPDSVNDFSNSSSTSPVNSTEAVEKKPTKIDNALTLKKFKEILEQESSGEKCKWKLKTLKQNQAVFELSWGCRVGFLRYTCTLFLHIQQTSPNESSVEFRRGEDDDFDSITELGYKAFHHLVREKSIMHPVCSKQTLLKLSEYSAIALKVETLMRDLLKLFFSRYTYNISEGVNPLKIHIDVENERRRSKCIVTCLVDLSSYPNIIIVPQVKHRYFDDLTDEIQRAVALVEPGKNYIWNITLAAHSV